MPDFDQSVAKQVGRDISNMRTPSSISFRITNFDLSKSSLSSSVQMNGTSGFIKFLNGSRWDADVKAYAAWLRRPYQALRSVIVFGVGKFSIEVRNSEVGRTLVMVISNPANSSALRAKRNFSGFKRIPLRPHKSNHSTACRKLCSTFTAQ